MNPDRSMTWDQDWGTEKLYKIFTENDQNYFEISNPDKLQEGDFITTIGKGHIAIVVRDPESGNLTIAEAPRSGHSVGLTKDENRFEKLKMEITQKRKKAFRDVGNLKSVPITIGAYYWISIDNTGRNGLTGYEAYIN